MAFPHIAADVPEPDAVRSETVDIGRGAARFVRREHQASVAPVLLVYRGPSLETGLAGPPSPHHIAHTDVVRTRRILAELSELRCGDLWVGAVEITLDEVVQIPGRHPCLRIETGEQIQIG